MEGKNTLMEAAFAGTQSRGALVLEPLMEGLQGRGGVGDPQLPLPLPPSPHSVEQQHPLMSPPNPAWQRGLLPPCFPAPSTPCSWRQQWLREAKEVDRLLPDAPATSRARAVPGPQSMSTRPVPPHPRYP